MSELRKSPSGQVWKFGEFTTTGNVYAYGGSNEARYWIPRYMWDSWEVVEPTWNLELNYEELQWLMAIVFGPIPTKAFWTQGMINDLRSKLLILKDQNK